VGRRRGAPTAHHVLTGAKHPEAELEETVHQAAVAGRNQRANPEPTPGELGRGRRQEREQDVAVVGGRRGEVGGAFVGL
jgi:hypothetical protein